MRHLRLSLAAVLAGLLGCSSTLIDPNEEEQSGEDVLAQVGTRLDAGLGGATATPTDPADNGSTGPGAGPGVPADNCGDAVFEVQPIVPDMLVLLDRSASMRSLPLPGRAQSAGVDRWSPSVAAVQKLTSTFEPKMAFGLMTFPSEGGMCAPGEVRVPVGMNNAAKIGDLLRTMQPGGGTPTSETLQRALTFYEGAPARAKTPRYVLLVTDGQPTCPTAGGNTFMVDAALETDKAMTIRALDALAAAGIKTFVVGYDAQLDPALASALAEFAKHGGTDKYYPVQDEASLVAAFTSISTIVTSCTFVFDQQVHDPDYIGVKLDGKQLYRDVPNGWTISGKIITILGESCNILKDGKPHNVEMWLECPRPQ